jgi:hypothetical protein
MYDLYWWVDNVRDHDLYHHYRAFRDFMDGIPLNNGHYQDARAIAPDPDLRAWGQADRIAGRGHLWVQNRQHTWRNVVDGVAITPVSGLVTIPDLVPAAYRITWWDTIAGVPFLTQTVANTAGTLALTLPAPLTTDVALKFDRVSDPIDWSSVYLPIILRND